jgi:acid phosphatase family membrane protein YuiD
MPTMFQRKLCTLSLAGLLMAAALPAAADILIVSSDVAALKAGTQLADADRLDLPAGVKVRVMLPSGKTQMLTGPVSGFVRDITKGERLVESVWAKAKELFETGGVDQSKMGAVRGLVMAKPVTAGFAWNVIPVAASGSVCVEKDAALAIERAEGDKSKDMIIVDAAANKKLAINFAEGARQADWPAGLDVKPDASYQLVPSGGRLRQITLRLVDKASTADAVALQTLLERDCRAQASAWLKR